MSSEGEIGVVVVGLGTAGKIRIRDLREKTCRLRLRGFVSRRQLEMEGVSQMTLEEALERSDVDAVMICTEPALHEETTRLSLEKGKHVLVEYPMAQTKESANNLFKLAEEKGLILYEENIAMLTPGYLAAKAKAGDKGLKQASYSITGGYNGWIEDTQGSGLPFICGVSGLQVMLSLFGDLEVKSATMERTDDGYSTTAQLETRIGSPIIMTLARQKSAKRIKQVTYEFEDGEVMDMSQFSLTTSKKGLFMQDMEKFDDHILKGKLPDDVKSLSLQSLELAEKIHSLF